MYSGTKMEQNVGLSQSSPQFAVQEELIKEGKIKYPKAVFFIFGSEFCERFSHYGLRAVLVLYLTNILSYTDNDATIIYHAFIMGCYFTPLIGAIVADNWLGKYRTIVHLSAVYSLGNIILSLSSAADSLHIPGRELTMLGLALIALGTGGIKPCVSTFGGEQFVLPKQEKQLETYFFVLYFCINVGSLLSIFITPILREDVKCFGQNSCFPLAFGVPAILMISAICFFIAGRRFYIILKHKNNILLHVCKCMAHAVHKICKTRIKRNHWLDHADDKYSFELIADIKAVLAAVILFVTFPIYWALHDQQGSRWVLQASRMNGVLGSWTVRPDQMPTVNSLLVLILIPLFDKGLYPMFAKFSLLKTPLQKMCVGGILLALAFLVSAVVEFQVQPTYAKLPGPGEAQLRIYNGMNSSLNLRINFTEEVIVLKPLEMWDNLTLKVTKTQTFGVNICNAEYTSCSLEDEITSSVKVTEGKAKSYFIIDNDNQPKLLDATSPESDYDVIGKSATGMSTLKVLYSFLNHSYYNQLELTDIDGEKLISFDLSSNKVSTKYEYLKPSRSSVWLRGQKDVKLLDINFEPGGVYTIVISEISEGTVESKFYIVAEPNSVHMLWLIPQYVILTVSEVMFSITSLEFSYTQTPKSMKSLISSVYLLTNAIGSLIVITVTEASIITNQAYEFLLFAGLMVADTAVLIYMASRYKYVSFADDSRSEGSEILIDVKKASEYHGNDNVNFQT